MRSLYSVLTTLPYHFPIYVSVYLLICVIFDSLTFLLFSFFGQSLMRSIPFEQIRMLSLDYNFMAFMVSIVTVSKIVSVMWVFNPEFLMLGTGWC